LSSKVKQQFDHKAALLCNNVISSLHLQVTVVRAGTSNTMTIHSISLQIQNQSSEVKLGEAYLICLMAVSTTVKALSTV